MAKHPRVVVFGRAQRERALAVLDERAWHGARQVPVDVRLRRISHPRLRDVVDVGLPRCRTACVVAAHGHELALGLLGGHVARA